MAKLVGGGFTGDKVHLKFTNEVVYVKTVGGGADDSDENAISLTWEEAAEAAELLGMLQRGVPEKFPTP